MVEEPENHTVRLLQEMRAEMREGRADTQALRKEVREMREDLTNRIDGNTIILNMLAGLLHNHEERTTKLELKT